MKFFFLFKMLQLSYRINFQTVEDKLFSAADGEGIELDLSKLNKKEG